MYLDCYYRTYPDYAPKLLNGIYYLGRIDKLKFLVSRQSNCLLITGEILSSLSEQSKPTYASLA